MTDTFDSTDRDQTGCENNFFIGLVPDQDGIKVASSTLAVAVMAAAFQFNEFSFIPIKFQAWNKLRK